MGLDRLTELWPGAVRNSDYNQREGYLQRQKVFADGDWVDSDNNNTLINIQFTNVYDKGYQAKLIAWKIGRQLVCQPIYTESNKHFGQKETLITVCVMTNFAGNKRSI